MNNLTSAQCDAFMRDHLKIVAGMHKNAATNCLEWEVFTRKNKFQFVSCRKTRQAAITVYWQMYHKDWTPPQIYDAEWALEYAKKNRLALQFYSSGNACVVLQCGTNIPNMRSDNDNMIELVADWKLKYDPDKVAQEETAMGLLKEAGNHLGNTFYPATLLDRIDTFLKEATDGS